MARQWWQDRSAEVLAEPALDVRTPPSRRTPLGSRAFARIGYVRDQKLSTITK
jgi:hypothetical protein